MKSIPNYKRIYTDILKKYPDKKEACKLLLSKKVLTHFDILKLDKIIFSSTNDEFDKKHISYDLPTIIHILNFQKKHEMTNSQLAIHFGMSRNTVTKWKNKFKNKLH